MQTDPEPEFLVPLAFVLQQFALVELERRYLLERLAALQRPVPPPPLEETP